VADYEKKKDEAIAKIGQDDKGDGHLTRYHKAYIRHAYGYAMVAKHLKETQGISYNNLCKISGITSSNVKEALEFPQKHEDAFCKTYWL